MQILLVRLRLIGDVVFTTPLLRALRRLYPDAHLTYLVEPLAAPVVHGNPHLDEVLIIPKRSGRPALGRRPRLGAAAARPAVRRRHRPARRSPQRVPDVGQRRADAHRLPDGGPFLDVHPRRAIAPTICIRGTRCSSSGTCWRRSASTPLTRRATRWRWPAIPTRPRAIDAVLRHAGVGPLHQLVVLHVSAGNPFRRWPQEAFAEAIVELARRDPARRFMVTSGPSDADAARAIVDAARARLGPAAGGAISHGQFDVAELRALADARGGVHWRRQRSSAHRRDDPDADRRAVRARRSPSARCRGATRAGLRRRSTRVRCRAARATSGTASRATFAA